MSTYVKTLLIAFAAICYFGNQASAQDKYAEYDCSYLGQTYDISVSQDKGKTTLWVDIFSSDKLSDVCGLMLTDKNTDDFIAAIKEAKEKYNEWVSVAKTNKVTDVTKEMNVESKNVNCYFKYGSKWCFDFNEKPVYKFLVREVEGQTHYLLMVIVSGLQSSSNEFMKHDGGAIIFASAEEIDEFLALIAPDKVAEFLNKPSAEDLFQD